MEVTGQGITLLAMRIWLYLYLVRLRVIYWWKQDCLQQKVLNVNHDNIALTLNVFVCLCFCRGKTDLIIFPCSIKLWPFFFFRNAEYEHVWNIYDWCWHLWFPWRHYRTALSKMAAAWGFLSFLKKPQWPGKKGNIFLCTYQLNFKKSRYFWDIKKNKKTEMSYDDLYSILYY